MVFGGCGLGTRLGLWVGPSDVRNTVSVLICLNTSPQAILVKGCRHSADTLATLMSSTRLGREWTHCIS